MSSRKHACLALCVWLQRLNERLESRENVCAEHAFLALPSALQAMSCADLAWHDTIEVCPSYANNLLTARQLLLLLLLLLHCHRILLRPSSFYQRQQAAMQRAVQLQMLRSVAPKGWRPFRLSPLVIRLWKMQLPLLAAGAQFLTLGGSIAEAQDDYSRCNCFQCSC
jgi:hypothetical protein